MNKTSGADLPSAAATVDLAVEVWQDHAVEVSADKVASETAVALVYNGISHAVMMATPEDLEDFALGFSLTEGIIVTPEEVFDIVLEQGTAGIEVQLTIAGECFNRLKQKRRSLTGRTGCGICGAESLAQARLPVAALDDDITVSHEAIDRAVKGLARHQPLQNATGAVHGAAWCDVAGNIVTVCEDLGRHNALDKLVGRLARADSPRPPGFLLISSRASYEMLQKAAMAKMAVVVAVSAPTSMAIDIARQAGITLLGFSRANRHVAYAGAQRLVGSPQADPA